MTIRTKVTALAVIAVVAHAPAAWADDVAKSDEFFERGAALYHEGKYSEAILEFKRGYDLAPHAVFEVNIALAYAKLGNFPEAIDWGERAVDDPALAGDAGVAHGARLQGWRLARSGTRVAEAFTSADVVASEPVKQPEEPAEPRGAWLSTTGLVVAGVGVAAVAVSGIVAVTLEDEKRDFVDAAAAGNASEYDRLKLRIDRGQALGRAALFAGSGLLVVGIGTWALARPSESASVSLAPLTGGGMVTFTFRQ